MKLKTEYKQMAIDLSLDPSVLAAYARLMDAKGFIEANTRWELSFTAKKRNQQ